MRMGILAPGLLAITLFVSAGCSFPDSSKSSANATGSTSTSTTTSVTGVSGTGIVISWAANRESAVNSTGGGYRVYYSHTNNFSPSSAPFVTVPYVSGATAPTTATLPTLGSGLWYIKVNAFSAMNSVGNTSAQIAIMVQ